MAKVVLIRHAESQKNLSDVIGGDGAPLTTAGRESARRIADSLDTKTLRTKIYHSAALQVKETAMTLSEAICCPCDNCDLLAPLNLGVLSNIPSSTAAQNFSDSFNSMTAWNSGRIYISDVNIDGMEDVFEFQQRNVSFLRLLQGQSAQYDLFVCIATRSTLIMLENLFSGRAIETGLYKHVTFNYCDSHWFDLII